MTSLTSQSCIPFPGIYCTQVLTPVLLYKFHSVIASPIFSLIINVILFSYFSIRSFTTSCAIFIYVPYSIYGSSSGFHFVSYSAAALAAIIKGVLPSLLNAFTSAPDLITLFIISKSSLPLDLIYFLIHSMSIVFLPLPLIFTSAPFSKSK